MKVHTRLKRKYGLTSSFRHTNFFRGGKVPKKGERTFKTLEGAKKWATETRKLKEGTYNIIPAKRNLKFKIELIEK
jgi:hypothetical protein